MAYFCKTPFFFAACFMIITGFCLVMPATAQTSEVVLSGDLKSEMPIGNYCTYRSGGGFKNYDQAPTEWYRPGAMAYYITPGDTSWMHVSLMNTSLKNNVYKLFYNNVQAGNCRLFIQRAVGIDSSQVTGSLVPLKMRASTDRMLAFVIEIQSGEKVDLYLRSVRKGIGITLTPVLYQLPVTPPVWPEYLLVSVLTVLCLICITSIFVFFYYPSLQVLLFFLYVLFGVLYVMAATGFGAMYLWTNNPRFEENAAVFLGGLSTCALLLFSAMALKLKSRLRWLYWYVLLSAAVYLLGGSTGYLYYAGLINIMKYKNALIIPYLVTLSSFFFMLVFTLYWGIRRDRILLWFTAIFISYFMMAVFLTMLELGLIPFHYRIHPLVISLGALPQVVLAFLFLLYRVVGMLKKQSAQIQEEKQKGNEAILFERLRISEELHDEVGATLSGISMYSHLLKGQIEQGNNIAVKQSLDIIQSNSIEMVNKLNDIVWLINPGKDSLQQLLGRLEDYAVQMAAVKGAQVNSNVNEFHFHSTLPAETRRNIYLLFKEAINNAVKYSNATQLELMVTHGKGNIELVFSDNGDGLPVYANTAGNGLQNMKRRAEEIHAVYSIDSFPERGTSIRLIVPIPQ